MLNHTVDRSKLMGKIDKKKAEQMAEYVNLKNSCVADKGIRVGIIKEIKLMRMKNRAANCKKKT